jgi:hypothetical protein
MKKIFSLLFLILHSLLFWGQTKTIQQEIHWDTIFTIDGQQILSCYEAETYTPDGLPVLTYLLPANKHQISINLTNQSTRNLTPSEASFISNLTIKPLAFEKKLIFSKKQAQWLITVIPLTIDSITKEVIKITSFTIETKELSELNPSYIENSITKDYASQSVLKDGDWYKIAIDTSTIYKIDYQDMVNYGIDPSTIEVEKIRLFGNGGLSLPESLSLEREDDLQELAIKIIGGEDGTFDEGDYILFYATGPEDAVFHKAGFYTYKKNIYTDQSYYFLNFNQEIGLRISESEKNYSLPEDTINSTPYFVHYEKDIVNLLASGKNWYEPSLKLNEKKEIHFSLKEAVLSAPIRIDYRLAINSKSNGRMAFDINEQYGDTNIIFDKPNMFSIAVPYDNHFSFTSDTPELFTRFYFLHNNTNSKIWFDHTTLNYCRNLSLSADLQAITFIDTAYNNPKQSYFLLQTEGITEIWDISDKQQALHITTEQSGDKLSFTYTISGLNKFIAFHPDLELPHPEFIHHIDNQNIHGLSTSDIVIVSPEAFLPEANRLAELHYTIDGLTSIVLTDEAVYNEFSSGKPTPVAIRNMMKFLYDKNETGYPRYLILFGDGTYDYKGIISKPVNEIPPFETAQSLSTTESISIEDFFGCLDNNEGDDGSGVLDIAVGRFIVSTPQQAKEMVDKVEQYMNYSEENGDWQRKICFIADDEDSNMFLTQADTLSKRLQNENPDLETQKIYFDSYLQIPTPKGDRYPDVNEAISKLMDEGAVIIDYIGHGSEKGWGEEQVLTLGEINSWTNERYPLFITATCEFSKFDDVDKISAGEITYLHPHGGAIAMITTFRLAWAGANHTMNKKFFRRLLQITDASYSRLGDIYIDSKDIGFFNRKNIGILGDPALKIALPYYNIRNVAFESHNNSDTIHALSKVHITAEILDLSDNYATHFNGKVKIQLFDKEKIIYTFENDASSYKTPVEIQGNLLWEGLFEVKSGAIDAEIFVPMDIIPEYGRGLIRLFAVDEKKSAMGSFNEFILGGQDTGAETDNTPPDIQLYMNNTAFHDGDTITNESIFIAKLSDEHGINISQHGFEHKMFIYIDNNTSNPILLQDYYHPSINSICCGIVNYPVENLTTGKHTIHFTVWDNYNNQSSSCIEFFYLKEGELIKNRIFAAPNPVESYTRFYFTNSENYQNFGISLYVYDLYGRERYSFSDDIFTLKDDYLFHTWDARDNQGHRLPAGIYIYFAIIKDEKGHQYLQSQKIQIH